ncbi:MAG: ADP-ribosylation factor-like protein [Candidatus Kariarchaeaceae archaeon]|jgi:hypothetical protein
MVQEQENVFVIRTLECDICQRFDSLLLTEIELIERVERNSLQIGSRIINHDDHLRIVYFDRDAQYLGDTMSLNVKEIPQKSVSYNVPLLLQEGKKLGVLRKIVKFLRTENFMISIIGPSMAGKTSLTRFLETGIPERMTHRINHPPTMGQSTKRFDLSGNKITIFDMGGQRNFWSLWERHFGDVKHIIYMIDGTSNSLETAIEGLDLLFEKITDQKLLIIFNKFDLLLDGYSDGFLQPEKLLGEIEFPDELKYWIVKTSVYNGLAYEYGPADVETPLSEAIIDFLERE